MNTTARLVYAADWYDYGRVRLNGRYNLRVDLRPNPAAPGLVDQIIWWESTPRWNSFSLAYQAVITDAHDWSKVMHGAHAPICYHADHDH